ncbi:MAG TPA: ABC transporter permease [Pirellulales bacterium]|jgi:putative ABC transport system permease protein|nr:ABC transporter permease [Pirellulales bacterium]
MQFAEVIAKNLLHRKTRAALTMGGLALAVMAMATLLSVAWGFANSAAAYYQARNVDIVAVRAGVSDRLTSTLRFDLGDRLKALPQIADVDASLTEVVSIGEGSLFGVPLRGLNLHGFAVGQLQITAGKPLTPEEHGQILLGVELADAVHKQAGDSLEVEGRSFTVAGIFSTTNPLESNSLCASLADVQSLMDRPQEVSEFQIRVSPTVRSDADLRTLCQEIENLRGSDRQPLGLKALPTRQFVDSATETKLAKSMAWGTSAIVLVLSWIGMLNTMLMSVLERTREIGILRAIGWKRSRIVRMILGESFILCFAAAIAGLLAAWAVLSVLSRWSVTRTLVSPGLSSTAVVGGLAIVLLAGGLGALYPALRGANISPTEALRYD